MPSEQNVEEYRAKQVQMDFPVEAKSGLISPSDLFKLQNHRLKNKNEQTL